MQETWLSLCLEIGPLLVCFILLAYELLQVILRLATFRTESRHRHPRAYRVQFDCGMESYTHRTLSHRNFLCLWGRLRWEIAPESCMFVFQCQHLLLKYETKDLGKRVGCVFRAHIRYSTKLVAMTSSLWPKKLAQPKLLTFPSGREPLDNKLLANSELQFPYSKYFRILRSPRNTVSTISRAVPMFLATGKASSLRTRIAWKILENTYPISGGNSDRMLAAGLVFSYLLTKLSSISSTGRNWLARISYRIL